MTRQTRITNTILRYPWLLPFIAVLMRGPSNARGIADELGCSRKLAVSGLHKLRVLGLVGRTDRGEFYIGQRPPLCILRYNQWFLTLCGATYIIAKVRRTSIKAYTVPKNLLDSNLEDHESPVLKHRVNVTRHLLSVASPYVGCKEDNK